MSHRVRTRVCHFAVKQVRALKASIECLLRQLQVFIQNRLPCRQLNQALYVQVFGVLFHFKLNYSCGIIVTAFKQILRESIINFYFYFY